MNNLTTALETNASQRATNLRMVQAAGILLALLNFAYILYKFLSSLRRADSAAVDVEALLRRANAGGRAGAAFRAALGEAVAGALTAVIALADPGEVVVGGEWGSDPVVLEAARSALAAAPRTVTLRAPSCTLEPALVGARAHAVAMLRRDLVPP